MIAHTPPRRWLAIPALLVAATLNLPGSPVTGRQFFRVTHFDELELLQPRGFRLTSPTFDAGFDFNQIVASWNVTLSPRTQLQLEAQPIFAERSGHFYTLGCWSANDAAEPSRSIPGQSDTDAEVKTDLLVLAHTARKFKIRLTIIQELHPDPTVLKFLGVSVLNSTVMPAPTTAPPGPRGLVLPVPTRSQLNYAGGDAWCSPTSLSMVLSYWSARLNRPDLDRDVPEVAAGVHDPGWPGTGNWPFNTAYAGSFPGMRGFVTRLADVTELEHWIAARVPVVASISYSVLKGQPNRADGHLVVVVGFAENGDVILNDPGTRRLMRNTFPREQFAAAWAQSHNTVYLVHPLEHPIPRSPDRHW
jgi:hypothetical protein